MSTYIKNNNTHKKKSRILMCTNCGNRGHEYRQCSEPVTSWGVVDSAVGAVIRGNPDFAAEIITYANNGDQIEIFGELTTLDGARWFQVLTDSGQSGLMLGSLVQTQTPETTDTD